VKAANQVPPLVHLIQAAVKRALTDKTFTIEPVIEMQMVCRSVLVGGLLSRVTTTPAHILVSLATQLGVN
jgi:hypothetical protein